MDFMKLVHLVGVTCSRKVGYKFRMYMAQGQAVSCSLLPPVYTCIWLDRETEVFSEIC